MKRTLFGGLALALAAALAVYFGDAMNLGLPNPLLGITCRRRPGTRTRWAQGWAGSRASSSVGRWPSSGTASTPSSCRQNSAGIVASRPC